MKYKQSVVVVVLSFDVSSRPSYSDWLADFVYLQENTSNPLLSRI